MAMATAVARIPGYGGPIRLGEPGSDGFHRSWIMLFPEGEYEHPQYGDLKFTQARLGAIKRLFDQRVRHIDIALDANHDGDKATGWLEQLQLRPASALGEPAGLWGLVRWTPYGVQLLKDQLYRYFSPEFGPWTDPATGKRYQNVLIGGGLTNRPFLKEMPAVQLADGTQISTKPWGSVDKACLPRSCFLDQGEPDKKSTWRLPVYEGAGPKDADGNYTQRGPLNINGVRAALAALGGAHTGTAMTGVPSGVKAKLQGWLKKYGGSSAQASEPRAHGGVEGNKHMGRNSQSAKMRDEDDEELDERQMFDDTGDGEDDSNETYDDGGDDGSDDGEVDPQSDTHGAFDGRHAHGKFGMHTHDGEGDHSDAPLKGKQMSGKSGKKMSEARSVSTRQLREAYEEQGQQLAEMREQLYRRDVADTLAGWDKGKFQFSEQPKSAGGKALPMVALSKRFRDAYSAFMLSEVGAGLPTRARKQLNSLVETALSAAVVDLSARGASFDQERRRTIRGGQNGKRAVVGEDIVELAEKRAEAKGKRLSELSYDERLRLMVDVEREIGNDEAPF